MPYITQEQRNIVDPLLDKLHPSVITYARLAYCAYRLAVKMKNDPMGPHNSWDHLSSIHRALIAAEREFYRRHIVPYEDDKIIVNGDIDD